jgi:UPF0489 domain
LSGAKLQLVLDIDFDFCVRPTLDRGFDDRREQPKDMRLWLTPDRFTGWLASRELLMPESFAGAVRSHEQVLPIWLDLMRSGRLCVPFTVLHIDAHPDMMDLDPEAEGLVSALPCPVESVLKLAKSGDYLQYAVRLGWVRRIEMLFPDDEEERISALASGSVEMASRVVKKPVISIGPGSRGGAEVTVRIGEVALSLGLHTRASLPFVPPPVATVLAHSPQFVPPHADEAFRRLKSRLEGSIHA